MKRILLSTIAAAVFVPMLIWSSDTSADTSDKDAVRLDVFVVNSRASFAVDGKKLQEGTGFLNVLRETPHEDGKTVLKIFLHSDQTKLKEIWEMMGAISKYGGYADQQFFVKCFQGNRPAWCRLTVGKPVAAYTNGDTQEK